MYPLENIHIRFNQTYLSTLIFLFALRLVILIPPLIPRITPGILITVALKFEAYDRDAVRNVQTP